MGLVFLLDGFNRSIALFSFELIMSHGQIGAAERIHISHGGCLGMQFGLLRRRLLLCSPRPVDPRSIPHRQVVRRGQPAEVIGDIRIIFRIFDQNCVIDIPGLLPPGVEDYLLPAMIGMKRGHHPSDRIVEEHGADAYANIELETVCIGEEGFVLAYWIPLVVEDHPAAPHPAWTGVIRRPFRLTIRSYDDLSFYIAPGKRSRLGLDLLLDLAAES